MAGSFDFEVYREVEMEIMDALESDIPAIAEIYNDAVSTSTAIFNDVPVSLEDRLRGGKPRVSGISWKPWLTSSLSGIARYGRGGGFGQHCVSSFLERFGFGRVGHLCEVGNKFGRFLDLRFPQRILANSEDLAERAA